MAWLKVNAPERPCKCRRPRVKRRHGDGSQWQCDTCTQVWELHRHKYGTHWQRHGEFCNACGPARRHTVDSPPRQTGTDWLYTEPENARRT